MQAADITPALVDRETARLLRTARSLGEDDVAAPSLCEGWSRGHVLTHLARNADGLARVCRAVLDGTDETMYAGDDVRDAEIVAGARRSPAELVTDIRQSSEALAPLLDRLGPEHVGRTASRTPGGPPVAAERVRYLRLRELVYHHVDLEAGFDFDQVSPELLELFLRETVVNLSRTSDPPGLTIRTAEGELHVIADGALHVTGPRAAVLAWLARGQTGGIRADGPLPAIPPGV